MRTFILFTLTLLISGYSIAQEKPTVTTKTEKLVYGERVTTITTLKVGKLTYIKTEKVNCGINLLHGVVAGDSFIESIEGKYNDVVRSPYLDKSLIYTEEQKELEKKYDLACRHVNYDCEVFKKSVTDVLTADEIAALRVHATQIMFYIIINKKGEIETIKFHTYINKDKNIDKTEAIRNLPIEKFAQIEHNLKTSLKINNYQPVLDLGANEITEMMIFKKDLIRITREKDTEKY